MLQCLLAKAKLRTKKMKRKNRKPEKLTKLKLQTEKCMLCRLDQKDHSEETRADHETITKIKAMAITAQEERNADLRLFRRSRE